MRNAAALFMQNKTTTFSSHNSREQEVNFNHRASLLIWNSKALTIYCCKSSVWGSSHQ